MIQHVVCLSLPNGWDKDALAEIMAALKALVGQIDGYIAFSHGPNIDAEGKSPGVPYLFVCRFTDRAALDRYATDPRHQTLGGQLVALCGGAERITVYDMDCSDGIA